MKKSIFKFGMVILLVMCGSLITLTNAENNKPDRPEKIEEVKSAQPSEYHTWANGRWKWDRKSEQWQWKSGYWRFDHDLYAWKNRYRYYDYYNHRYWRYALVPIGRGYYRIIRY